MSAIALPNVRFTGSLTPNVVVPVESVQDVRQLVYNNSVTNNNTGASYYLEFDLFDPNNRLAGNAGLIRIKFATAAAMATGLADYLTATTTSIV